MLRSGPLAFALLALAGSGCVVPAAEPVPELDAPDILEIGWFFCRIDPVTCEFINPNCESSASAVAQIVVARVFDAETGEGIEGVDVEAESSWPGVAVDASPVASDEAGRAPILLVVKDFPIDPDDCAGTTPVVVTLTAAGLVHEVEVRGD